MKLLLAIVSILALLQAKTANHLLNQTSPYLKQHLFDKIKWYPWCDKAFKKAKKEHKLIFLSIGYSTCHWCHEMQKNSFNNSKIANILNRYYICILVDREESPQIDKKYQLLYKNIKGKRGGWPLNVILDANKRVFFISKYIPPVAAYGSKGLEFLALKFAKEYHEGSIKSMVLKPDKKSKNEKKELSTMIQNLYKNFDKIYKGFGQKAKYPNSSAINLLLDIYSLTKNKKAKMMAFETLDMMARSSIYDQTGGGFFRYTTDRKWLSPHFEKMLYTNALLIQIYTKAYLIEKKHRYKDIVLQSLREFDKHFRNSAGLYYSASDANNQNEEGRYYIYRYSDALKYLIKNGIKKSEAKNVLLYLDITKDGNFDSEFALAHIAKKSKPALLKEALRLLNKKREAIDFPFVDEKIITSWNAMMIKAKFEASLFNDKYKKEAVKSLNLLLKRIQDNDGSLYHYTIGNFKAKQKGFLEDYAYIIDTLIYAYDLTLDDKYLQKAKNLTKITIKKFYKDGEWFMDELHFTKADTDDSYYASGLSMMADDLLKMAAYESSLKLQALSKDIIKKNLDKIFATPQSNAKMSDSYLAFKANYIVIKSNPKNLLKISDKLSKLHYPFFLKKSIDDDNFLLCVTGSCFGYGDIKKVERILSGTIKDAGKF